MSAGTQATCGGQSASGQMMLAPETELALENDVTAAQVSDAEAPNPKLDPRQASLQPSPQPGPSPPAVGVQASVGLGLQATIGGDINVHVGSVSIYEHSARTVGGL